MLKRKPNGTTSPLTGANRLACSMLSADSQRNYAMNTPKIPAKAQTLNPFTEYLSWPLLL